MFLSRVHFYVETYLLLFCNDVEISYEKEQNMLAIKGDKVCV
jgi:hypothetical protein